MATDLYSILGVKRNATVDDIKAAYRKLARKFHPDLNPNDPVANRKFQEINEANEVLSDPESRKKYDKHGEHWKHAEQIEEAERQRAQQAQGAPFGTGGQAFTDEYGDLGDHFRDLFGGGGRRQVKFRGPDLQATLQLDLMDAYRTHQRTLNVNNKQLRITVPAGVEDGQTIKIAGHGGPGANGGPSGDLYITFRMAAHPDFKRVGKDLYVTRHVDLASAMLGAEITVDTLDGKVKLKLAPETQNGTIVKLKGKGFPVYKKPGTFGDLYVTYAVDLPTQLSEREKELFAELAALRKKT